MGPLSPIFLPLLPLHDPLKLLQPPGGKGPEKGGPQQPFPAACTRGLPNAAGAQRLLNATETTQPSWTSRWCRLQQSHVKAFRRSDQGAASLCRRGRLLPELWEHSSLNPGLREGPQAARVQRQGPQPPSPAPSPAKAAGSLQKGFLHPEPAFPTGRVSSPGTML